MYFFIFLWSFSTKKALLRDLAHRELAGVLDVVVTGILTICSFEAYSLIDSSLTLSYIT